MIDFASGLAAFKKYIDDTTFISGVDDAIQFMKDNVVCIQNGDEIKLVVRAENEQDFITFIQRANVKVAYSDTHAADLSPFHDYIKLVQGNTTIDPEYLEEDGTISEEHYFYPMVETPGYILDCNSFRVTPEDKEKIGFTKTSILMYDPTQIEFIAEVTYPAILTFYSIDSIDSFDRSRGIKGSVFEVLELTKIPPSTPIFW